jgi:cobalt/nickel transport system permease protein
LAATTGFPAICRALGRLGMPQVFVQQLQFMYRYLFVLFEEAERMVRARELRSFRNRGMGIGPLSSMVGHLLLRTWERAERIHMAMLCRGFSGEAATLPAGGLKRADLLFLLGWITLFLLLRLYNIPRILGGFFI